MPRIIQLPRAGHPFIPRQLASHDRCIAVLCSMQLITRRMSELRKEIDDLREYAKPSWRTLDKDRLHFLLAKWGKYGKASERLAKYYRSLMYSILGEAQYGVESLIDMPEPHTMLAKAI